MRCDQKIYRPNFSLYGYHIVGPCEDGNEPLGSIKGKFLDYLKDYYLLNKDSAPWS
jgi:hypothetical protein